VCFILKPHQRRFIDLAEATSTLEVASAYIIRWNNKVCKIYHISIPLPFAKGDVECYWFFIKESKCAGFLYDGSF